MTLLYERVSVTHTHLRAQAKQRLFILLLSPHCALAHISTVQQGPFYAFTESFPPEDIQMIFTVFRFSLRNALLMGEAGCAQNIKRPYLEAAKRGKPDISDPESSATEHRVEGQRAVGLKCEINNPNTGLLQHSREL